MTRCLQIDCFNSTTVQLIPKVKMWGDKSQLLSFNSTTVQLILYYSDDTLFADRLFQFHNGTINTKSKNVG